MEDQQKPLKTDWGGSRSSTGHCRIELEFGTKGMDDSFYVGKCPHCNWGRKIPMVRTINQPADYGTMECRHNKLQEWYRAHYCEGLK